MAANNGLETIEFISGSLEKTVPSARGIGRRGAKRKGQRATLAVGRLELPMQ
jgi:hypothetical protein